MIDRELHVIAGPRHPILGSSGSGSGALRRSFPAMIPESAPVAGKYGAEMAVIAEIRVLLNAG